MKVGVIGLGRMGAAIAYRALKARHCVLGFDPDTKAANHAQEMGVEIYDNVTELARNADVIWLMVAAGQLVDTTLAQIVPAIQSHAIIVDGGNSHFADSIKRAHALAQQKIAYLDCGTSGGLAGKEQGFCLMVGGSFEAYQKIEPLLHAIAMPGGVGYLGPSGAGHYVKMIHNGIEYGLLQAYAEGFNLLREGDFKDLDLEKIARVWQHGAVIRSWLLDLAHEVLKLDQNLASIDGKVQEGGTGAWTVQNAHDNGVWAPVIEKSLEVRAWSRATGGNFATKLIQMIRHAFGGHAVIIKPENEL